MIGIKLFDMEGDDPTKKMALAGRHRRPRLPPLTLLLLALILGCPLAMYYLGMTGHTLGGEAARDGMHEHSDRSASKPKREDSEYKKGRIMGEK
ncbi:hypothetical protein [Candidatus Manganitrophus noduliformans]|uniref:Uncharacterized protein n=1 Tax=Candidatus Manganitrophus noduliformans TaxID=2606439 RepID=A0A7X6DU40_9BACT|nr:hypothetical protein [Candidatus Manganitrophus noduliformans]NKE73411.1 hypothetical protein [Candidatus Manganitrophus noduliformans]